MPDGVDHHPAQPTSRRTHMRTVRKGKLNHWYAYPIVGGTKLTVHAATKRDLIEIVAALKKDHHGRKLGLAPAAPPHQTKTFDEVADLMLVHYTYAATSRATLAYNLKRSRSRFGDTPIQEITLE